MPLILPGNVGSATAATGFNVANSARFENSSSDYLNRTPSSASNRKTFTFSFWVKRTKLGTNDTIYNVRPDSNGANRLSFHSTTDTFRIALEPIGKYIFTTRKFRDVSAWYHIVAAFDTTQGTASDRVKIYINGVQEGSLVKGDGGAATYPDQNTDLDINRDVVINIGRDLETSSDFIDLYLAEFVFIDGTALDPTSFGEFDSDSGIWKPIDVSGLTFGTNGFYLDFEDSSALGNDAAGSNNFTVNNLTAIDQSTDTCTNNFATLNPLDSFYEASTFSEGNLKIVTEASLYSYNTSTIGLTQGKWYCEVYIETSPHPTTKDSIIGIAGRMSEGNDNFLGQSSDTYGIYGGNGNIYNNGGTTSYGATHTTNDIVGIYMDLDNNKLYFAKNGTIMNSGTGHTILAPNLTTAGAYFMVAADYGNGYQGTYRMNFGSPIYALSSANTDANGFGSFEYNPSSGTFDGASKDFLAICTKNLAEFG